MVRAMSVLLLWLLVCAPAHAQPATPADAAAFPRAGITDLAAAYIRFERRFFSDALPDERCAELNRAFDQATLGFFSGSYTEVVRRLNAALQSLDPSPWEALAGSLRVRADPAVLVAEGQVRLRIDSLYAVPAPPDVREGIKMRISLRSRFSIRDEIGVEFSTLVPVELAGQDAHVHADVTIDVAPPHPGNRIFGVYDIVVSTPDRNFPPVHLGTFQVLAHDPDAKRGANEQRAKAVAEETPIATRAKAIFVARNARLSSSLDPTSAVVTDLVDLDRFLSNELDALLAGRNPYSRLAGDHWRPVGLVPGTDETGVPARVFAPRLTEHSAPVPLLIAVHGAGADEHMFFDGYGQGALKRLAEQHNLLVVCPRAGPFSAGPATLDRLIDDIALDYPVDRTRVYLVGHSMGGGIVAAWARARPDTVAAVCTIAGVGGFSGATKIPPALVVTGELDALVSAPRARAAAARARDAQLPVEYREFSNYGHTLVVAKALPDVIAWLLSQRRPE
jgi:predicted esterase